MIELFIAKKYILERKRQSIVSIIGIMIGVVVLTVSIGISNGLDDNMIKSVLSITSHIKYQPKEKIENYTALKDEIERIEGVKGVVPNIPSQGIFKSKNRYGEFVSGIKVQGFDLVEAKKSMDLDKKLLEGTLDTSNDSILIGSELSHNSGAVIGDKVTLVTSDGKEIKFRVSGIFQTGYYDYDLNVVIINLKAAQYITYSQDSVDEFEILLNNPYKAEVIAKELINKKGLFVRTWGEMNRNLLSALSLEKTVMILVFSLIVIIAGFVVWVTLNMLVREKIKDIGIMRAMGYSKKNISKIFLLQGMILGGLGILLGVLLALLILWYIKNYSLPGISSIYYINKIPVIIGVKEITIIVSANFLIIILSSIFPAFRAAKLETQEALKYE